MAKKGKKTSDAKRKWERHRSPKTYGTSVAKLKWGHIRCRKQVGDVTTAHPSRTTCENIFVFWNKFHFMFLHLSPIRTYADQYGVIADPQDDSPMWFSGPLAMSPCSELPGLQQPWKNTRWGLKSLKHKLSGHRQPKSLGF